MFTTLVHELKERKLTIGSVESLTAGLFCSKVAEIPGASAVLRGGLVTYASELKTVLANVDKNLIETKGVVSEEVARAMAVGGKEKLNVDICVSFTGNAGPTVLDNKKVGEVYMGIAFNDKIDVFHHIFTGDRNEIRNCAVQFACEKILQMLK